MKTKTKSVKKIIGQKSHHEIKGKNLVIESIKIFADKSLRTDSATLNLQSVKNIVKSIKKNDVEAFRAKFYYLARKEALKIDGQSQKLGLCKHARARQHVFNVIADVCERQDLIVNYGQEKIAA